MKIIELRAENVKRLKAIDIRPDGHVQVIGGRNAQGKSSVLDAIWLALGGAAASRSTARPIRDGEDSATVTLDLGDLVVTRNWTPKGTSLKVTSADGAAYSGPQGMLDALVGRLSFDPLEFTRLKPAEQRQALLGLVNLPIDVDELDRERKRLFEERTDLGRRARVIGDTTVDESLPDKEVTVRELIAQITAAQAANHEREDAQQHVDRARRQIAELEASLAQWRDYLTAAETRLAAAPRPSNIAALEAELGTVEERNAAIRLNNTIKADARRKAELTAEYDALTARLNTLDETKANALAAATFPVPGLAFDETGVIYQGVPFSQASSAEQIRVSLAMAMAMNPELRVVRILDGSLLDGDNLAMIEEMAREQDYQVWIERVGNADEGAIVIEDGEVV